MKTFTVRINSQKTLFIIGLITLITISNLTFAQWVQVSVDIDGEAAGDFSGSSVSFSLDGKTLAVGAPENGGGTGQVRVYNLIGSTWTQIGGDIDGEAGGDNSGAAISLSADGSTVAIGAPNNDGTGANAGHVRIYNLVGSVWTQIGGDIDGEAASDNSGTSVSLSADGMTVAIGAIKNDGSGSGDAGHVRVYNLVGVTWTQVGNDIDGEADNTFSGSSVSLNSKGDTLAVGAKFNFGNGFFSGHTRIFNLVGATWTQIGVDIDGEAMLDLAGSSVSLSKNGKTVAIGAPDNNGTGANAGHVRIYDLVGATWTQVGSDIDGEAAGDKSGLSVSISADGKIVAIGAPNNNSIGHVRIYNLIGSTWTQVGSDIDGEAGSDQSGFSVSLSSDGKMVAIGAPNNNGTGTDAGHVRVYKFCTPTTSNFSVTACDNYTVPSGNATYTNSQTVNDTISNTCGVDSIMTITINIITNTIDTSTTTVGFVITANDTGAVYQWLDCNNGNSPIIGDTNQSFTATANGNYAVMISKNICIDTSACVNITGVGIEENTLFNRVSIFPNPSQGSVNIDLGGLTNVSVKVLNVQGQLIYLKENINTNMHKFELGNIAGIYFIEISIDGESAYYKLIKE